MVCGAQKTWQKNDKSGKRKDSLEKLSDINVVAHASSPAERQRTALETEYLADKNGTKVKVAFL